MPYALMASALSFYLIAKGAWIAVAFGWLVLLPLGFLIYRRK